MNEAIRASLWAEVWKTKWLDGASAWAYLLTDSDIVRLGTILDIWAGYEPGSDLWTLDAMGGRLRFGFRIGLPDAKGEAIFLFGKEGYSPLTVVPLGWPDGPPGLVGWTEDQLTHLRYNHARHVKHHEFQRAISLERRNEPIIAAGHATLETAVASARRYLERRDGRWRYALPGA